MRRSPSSARLDRTGTHRTRVRAAAGLLASALLAPVAGRAAERALLLAVEVNGRSTDLAVDATETDGALEVAAGDLRALGLRVPADQRRGPFDPVPLGALPGVSHELDERRQILRLRAADAALLPQTLRPGGEAPGARVREPARSGWAGVLNYAVVGTAGRAGTAAGLLEARGTTPWGVAGTGLLAQAGPGGRVARLDTVLAGAEWDGMRRWRLGDVVAGGPGWTRPFRLGGAQVASDFAMRPDLVTHPVPVLGGRAGVPSTVDVFVNGVRQQSHAVQPGPFELSQPPVVTGAGEVAVVVRDALGRETTRTLDFYVAPALLAPGLTAYSVEAGWIRTRYALPGDGYRQPAGAATIRRGLADWLTAEAHAEVSPSVRMGGVGAAVDAFGLGLVSASLAASSARGGTGVQWGVGFERMGRRVGISASTLRTAGRFRDVPSAAGDPVPRSTTRLGVSLALDTWGSLRAAYVDVHGSLVPEFVGAGSPRLARGRARVASLTYARPLTDAVGLYATGYRDFAARGATGLGVGLSVTLSGRRSVGVSAAAGGGRPGGHADAVQAALSPWDLGWRVGAARGAASRQTAEATYVTPWATATGGVERSGRAVGGRAGLQGAVVLAGRDVFLANRVDDAFAVVDTQGLAGVRVLHENRPVGRTDRGGRLLVPGLRGWEPNRLSIDPSDLPADVEAGELHQVVRPRDRAGVVVPFAIRRGLSAVVSLEASPGRPVRAGSTATLARTGKTVPVGHGGQAFLTDLTGEEELRVEGPAGRCRARFTFRPVGGDIPGIGPIPCRPEAAAP